MQNDWWQTYAMCEDCGHRDLSVMDRVNVHTVSTPPPLDTTDTCEMYV